MDGGGFESALVQPLEQALLEIAREIVLRLLVEWDADVPALGLGLDEKPVVAGELLCQGKRISACGRFDAERYHGGKQLSAVQMSRSSASIVRASPRLVASGRPAWCWVTT